jgi:hypothetical protein
MNQKLREIIQSTQGGQFITINGYVNKYGEVTNQQVHADANYESVHERSIKKLDALEADTGLVVDIKRNAWFDSAGVEHTREAKGRVRKELQESVKAGDVDLKIAFDKVRQSILAPKKDAGEYVGSNSAFQIEDECYLHNVLVENKEVIKPGVYPITCKSKVSALVDWVKDQLPIGQYRTYKLNSTNCQSISASGELFVF